MRYRGVLYSFLLLALVVPSFASARSSDVIEYKVRGGDTLWGISGGELKDTFLWPKIWKENPEVSNPDRIFPGQTIRIPLYLLQKERQAEPVASGEKTAPAGSGEPARAVVSPAPAATHEPERIPLTPLVGREALMASGYIADSVNGVGRIDGSPENKLLFGNNDTIYVRMNDPVRIGDRFYIIRQGARVRHPLSGKTLGYVVQIRGVAEISKFSYGETEARIVQMFDDVQSGDILDTYYEINPPITTGEFRKPNIRGTVVASQNLKILNGNAEIVYIDKGQDDGIEIGDVLQTLIVGKHTIPNSRIQIINSRARTSTAIIRSFSSPVAAGNVFVKAE
ncbi:MAG: LysM peptidoglycan-binding domain-containing protein [Nitrospiraceae bacterium]|nr:LysM peptidoglycan-binding domain-containing protein [Nitrospiraceae bacterium]